VDRRGRGVKQLPLICKPTQRRAKRRERAWVCAAAQQPHLAPSVSPQNTRCARWDHLCYGSRTRACPERHVCAPRTRRAAERAAPPLAGLAECGSDVLHLSNSSAKRCLPQGGGAASFLRLTPSRRLTSYAEGIDAGKPCYSRSRQVCAVLTQQLGDGIEVAPWWMRSATTSV
jgi:hypothetical protein